MLKLLSLDGEPFALAAGSSLMLLPDRKPCMGYANCCVCPACVERASKPLPALEAPRQPWDAAA